LVLKVIGQGFGLKFKSALRLFLTPFRGKSQGMGGAVGLSAIWPLSVG
jgi:hypothetical protein